MRVVLSGVNPSDTRARRHTPVGVTGRIPHQDGAGFVDAVGAGVAGICTGDRVWLWEAAKRNEQGTAQEFVIVPAEHAVPLPTHVSMETGAALGVPVLTAHALLTRGSGSPTLRPGSLASSVVVVRGASGAVGHAALQLAAWAGARCIAITGSQTLDSALHAGAAQAVDRTDPDLVERVRAVGSADIVLTPDPSSTIGEDIQLLTPGGSLVVYASAGSDAVSVPIFEAMRANVAVHFAYVYTVTRAAKAQAVEDLSLALQAGALSVGADHGLPVRPFPLEAIAAAHRAVDDDQRGKVVIQISDLDGRTSGLIAAHTAAT